MTVGTKRTGYWGDCPARTLSALNPPDAGGKGNGEKLHSKETRPVSKGDILSFRLSGAGGYGPPEKRNPDAITEDVADGFVTPERARADYGAESASDRPVHRHPSVAR